MYDDYQTRPRALWIATLVFCVVVIADSWFRWATFQYGTFDVAFYTQAFWLALHGQAHVSLLDVPLMGNHAEPICYLLLPFFWIWKSPMLFVVAQALMLATMPFTAWRIARRMEFSTRGAMWMALATLLAPATGFVALHEFHPEALAAPLVLLVIEARLARRPGLFWIWFILALACKENVALMLGWMCAVHWILERDRGREWQMVFNILPGAIALGWVALYGFWLAPKWNGGRVDYGELYTHIGGISGIFSQPGRAFGAAWHGLTSGNLVWGLLLPFALLPLLRMRWLIVAAPLFAQHLLSSRSSEWSLQFHYAAPLLPLVWIGAAEACSRLFWRDVMAGWIVLACVACQPWFGPVRAITGTIAGAGDALWARKWKAEMLAMIPPNASVTAGLPYLSHLAKRPELHSLHLILKGLKTLSRAEYVQPSATDAVVLDTGDLATFNRIAGYYHPERLLDGRVVPASDLLLHKYMRQSTWSALSRNELTIFIRGESSAVAQQGGDGKILDDFHTLVAVQTGPPTPWGDSMLFAMTWDLKPGRPLLPWVSLFLQGQNGRLYTVGKGPVAPGLESGRFTETWLVRRPNGLPPGKYRGQLMVYDSYEFDLPQPRFARRRFDVGEFELR